MIQETIFNRTVTIFAKPGDKNAYIRITSNQDPTITFTLSTPLAELPPDRFERVFKELNSNPT